MNKNKTNKNIALCIQVILVILISFSCKKEEPSNSISNFNAAKVLVLNEGNFMWGNASLSMYDLNTDSISTTDPFYNINNSAIGDVLQSASIIGNTIYLTVNNSGKIWILNKNTLKISGAIEGLLSPRYVVCGADSALYVSDLYDNHIGVYHKNTGALIKKITCYGWTEKMLVVGNTIYVCNKKSAYVYMINTNSKSIVDSFSIGYGANSILMDASNRLWISTDGNSTAGISPSIQCFSTTTPKPTQLFSWNLSSVVHHVCYNSSTNTMYCIQGENIFSFSSIASSFPSTAIISKAGAIWYGMEIEPKSGDIFLSDAKDYVQQSDIYRYNADGSKLIAKSKAGIISNGFLFYK